MVPSPGLGYADAVDVKIIERMHHRPAIRLGPKIEVSSSRLLFSHPCELMAKCLLATRLLMCPLLEKSNQIFLHHLARGLELSVTAAVEKASITAENSH